MSNVNTFFRYRGFPGCGFLLRRNSWWRLVARSPPSGWLAGSSVILGDQWDQFLRSKVHWVMTSAFDTRKSTTRWGPQDSSVAFFCGWLPWFMVYGNKLVFMDVNGVYEPTNITAGAPSCRLSSCSLKQRLLKVRRKSMSPIFRHTKEGSHEWKTCL